MPHDTLSHLPTLPILPSPEEMLKVCSERRGSPVPWFFSLGISEGPVRRVVVVCLGGVW